MKTHLWCCSPTKKLTNFTANKELFYSLAILKYDERIKLIILRCTMYWEMMNRVMPIYISIILPTYFYCCLVTRLPKIFFLIVNL